MKPRTYTLDQAAALLNLGRNTLARRLREAGILDRRNLPRGRYRGNARLMRVETGTYHHPIIGWTHYGRTEITDAGLDHIADRLGIDIERLPADGDPLASAGKRNMNQNATSYSRSF
ncbi:Phage antirepressor protein KilAC domain-containing protein [Modicisalibacter ilicicola DSM 19980]|uniref:Phage antirepressor protein KilAC domain-containing protein n=1 Tax=Modicisalibacter ilicicola DSM 19980 TaxID=1121942 RepID=A0A1M4Y1T9_9GAMM|nr:phage antirepressor KilAC domain-containing protein [Halomonas ilicicola]SHE99675.1 Phage antirepressor protein KilAC domain-containing protein [Halomonas ilicicola DSM 19980]